MFKKVLIITTLFISLVLVSCNQNSQNAEINSVDENNQQSVADNKNSETSDNSPTGETSENSDAQENTSAQDEKYKNIKPEHAEILKNWLKSKPNLQIAQVGEFPPSRLERLREWKNDKNAHPYYASGDFNGNGKEDFAVLLNNAENSKVRTFAVFEAGSNTPVMTDINMFKDFILSYNSDNNSLAIGSFESDDGLILTPKGDSYIFVSMLPEGK